MTELSPATLDHLAIPVPGYDRSDVTPGVVHFGVGAFHRAHQASYIDTVLAAGSREWGIVGVVLLPGGPRHARSRGDPKRSLHADHRGAGREPGNARHRQHPRRPYAPDDPERVLGLLTAPSTRIVSLTVTEGGYAIDDATGEFAPSDPPTLADLAGSETPQSVWDAKTIEVSHGNAAESED